MKPVRVVAAALSLSAAGFGALVVSEGYREHAYAPVPGDRVTYGFGNTFKADGTPVKPGDRIDPVAAVRLKIDHIAKDELNLKRCVKAPLTQNEWDAYVSLAYNIGSSAFCASTLVKKLNAEDYKGACDEILRWDKFKGQPLKGLTIRRQREHKQCLAAQ